MMARVTARKKEAFVPIYLTSKGEAVEKAAVRLQVSAQILSKHGPETLHALVEVPCIESHSAEDDRAALGVGMISMYPQATLLKHHP